MQLINLKRCRNDSDNVSESDLKNGNIMIFTKFNLKFKDNQKIWFRLLKYF